MLSLYSISRQDTQVSFFSSIFEMSNLNAEQFGYNNQHDTTPTQMHNAIEPLPSNAPPPSGHFGDEYQLLQPSTYYDDPTDGSCQQAIGMDFAPPKHLDPEHMDCSDNVQGYPPELGGEDNVPSYPSIPPRRFYQNQQAAEQIHQQPTEFSDFTTNNLGHSQFQLEVVRLMRTMQTTRDECSHKAFLDGQRSNQALVEMAMGMLNAMTNWSRLHILKEDSAKWQIAEQLLRYGEAQYAPTSEENVPEQ